MSSCSTRSISRASRLPEKLRDSLPEKPEKAGTKATKNQDDSKEYDVKVISVCRCAAKQWALCHFVGYSKSKDDWRPFDKVSAAALDAAASVTRCSPMRCKRIKNHITRVNIKKNSSSGVIQSISVDEAIY